MANNRFNAWAGPSIAGTDIGVWGPWNTSTGLIIEKNTSRSVHLDFATISKGPSAYYVQIEYFNGENM